MPKFVRKRNVTRISFLCVFYVIISLVEKGSMSNFAVLKKKRWLNRFIYFLNRYERLLKIIIIISVLECIEGRTLTFLFVILLTIVT